MSLIQAFVEHESRKPMLNKPMLNMSIVSIRQALQIYLIIIIVKMED